VDDEFLKQRVRLTRDLAQKADPFTKRLLVDLANSYEARPARPSQATVRVLSIAVATPPAKPDS
jgi:hypothetical protein